MSSPAALATTGPSHYLTDYHFGAMMSHQMLGFMGIMVGLMSVLLLVRHTRAEEETGRAEQVRANVVGRHAHLTAAMGVVTATNVVLALLITIGLGGLGIEGITWNGALLYGAAHAAMGLVFTAVAAVTVQITEHSRGAAGMALAVVGIAYFLRAAGDVGTSALSWLSPIGWAQATWAFLENRWWPLLLALALAAGLVAAAFELSTRRDVGAGLRQPRPGAAAASNALVHPLGFALRLHRGMMLGFAIGMFVLGAAYGSILGEVEEMLSGIDVFSDAVAEIGGATITESFASMIMVIMAIVASVYVVLAALRPRAEENAGRAEPVLATPLSRVGMARQPPRRRADRLGRHAAGRRAGLRHLRRVVHIGRRDGRHAGGRRSRLPASALGHRRRRRAPRRTGSPRRPTGLGRAALRRSSSATSARSSSSPTG